LNVEPTVRTAGFDRLKRSMAHDQY
jgi:hypothetical protein